MNEPIDLSIQPWPLLPEGEWARVETLVDANGTQRRWINGVEIPLGWCLEWGRWKRLLDEMERESQRRRGGE